MSFDANDPKQVADAKSEAGRRVARDKEVMKAFLGTQNGRDWMWRFLSNCHVFATSFRPGEPETTAFIEGERNIGLRVFLEVLSADPESYLLMVKESNEKVQMENQSG